MWFNRKLWGELFSDHSHCWTDVRNEASSFLFQAEEACLNFLTVVQKTDKNVNNGPCGVPDKVPTANNINHDMVWI